MMFTVVLLISAALSVAGQSSSGPCTYNGLDGQCTSSCSNNHVSSSQGASGCGNFASNIKCCVPYAKCSANGSSGFCTKSCSGSHVSSSQGASGCGSFADNVKCCVSTSSTPSPPSSTSGSYGPCTYQGKNGQCVTSCSTGSFGASSQGANGCGSFPSAVKCCVASGSSPTTAAPATTASGLPSGPSCVAYNRGGVCINKSTCPSPYNAYASSPGSVSGCESFASAIQCCSPGTPGPTSPPSPGSGSSDRVPQACLDIIKQFEGFFSKAYNDPRTGGKPITIGWGSTRRRDGSEFHLGDTITREQAEDLLRFQLESSYIKRQEDKIPGWFQLNSNQRSAIISFAYNVGAAFYGNSGYRTISNVIANREWSKIRAAFILYRNPGSNVEAGLRRRREAEATLFLKPVTNAAGLEEEPIAQVELTAEDDVDFLDPSLHSDNSVAIGLGVTAAIVVLALIIAAVVWICVGKRSKQQAASETHSASSISMNSSSPYKSSYTCSHCKTTFFAAADLAAHVEATHA